MVNLEVNTVFGGCKIIVPEDWSVSSQVVGVVGGFANNTKMPTKGDEKTRLVITGAAVMGGGEVAN